MARLGAIRGHFGVSFWSLFETIFAFLSEVIFGVMSGIVLEPILIVFGSRFGSKFEPKGWIDAKRMLFEN